jgi:hypothetical protein
MAVCSDSWRICCEAAAEEINYSIPYKYGSDREREIFESISARIITKERAEQKAAQERAFAEQRKYHDLYRQDALMLMHDEAQVNQLLSQGGLRPEQYRAGLEKIYPMLYLAVCMEMFGPKRVGDLLCTSIFYGGTHPTCDAAIL